MVIIRNDPPNRNLFSFSQNIYVPQAAQPAQNENEAAQIVEYTT
jgi:hypothetical protein